jgi:hypothetical protein
VECPFGLTIQNAANYSSPWLNLLSGLHGWVDDDYLQHCEGRTNVNGVKTVYKFNISGQRLWGQLHKRRQCDHVTYCVVSFDVFFS